MELTYYADFAVRLVNTEEPRRGIDTLTTADAVRELLADTTKLAARATDADVTRLRGVRTRLRAVFAAAAETDEVRAVDLLNALLMEYPCSPQIAGHDYRDEDGNPKWHMHLADNAASAGAAYAAVAAMGLAFSLTDLGVDRLGVCEAYPCRHAYLDTSTNRSRRYCSDRCATRANVAAYRARKRLESGRTAEKAQPASEPGER
ncbi:CGNR zinc finger domain-containing protein [Streptomyces sp. JJ66]|uniref:CGNR zinc finger domain-containing protein n=1 Tax=Streptomyces sp. JJ66 TaxID=2803843 RepID=UPI001C596E24|nr:CGNR zinc finger domain-containing protein [Streptomyces sp. JJ66]MBW1603043.1 CGNR zinc finger domain-containing protein [Streptomyces sp. JJ66]